MTELRPCPFCGANARITMFAHNIECENCGSVHDPDSWNRRTPGPATQEILKVFKCMVQKDEKNHTARKNALTFIAEWEDQ